MGDALRRIYEQQLDGRVTTLEEILPRVEVWRGQPIIVTIFIVFFVSVGYLPAILVAPLLIRPFGNPGGDAELAVGLSRAVGIADA